MNTRLQNWIACELTDAIANYPRVLRHECRERDGLRKETQCCWPHVFFHMDLMFSFKCCWFALVAADGRV